MTPVEPRLSLRDGLRPTSCLFPVAFIEYLLPPTGPLHVPITPYGTTSCLFPVAFIEYLLPPTGPLHVPITPYGTLERPQTLYILHERYYPLRNH
jgi:hypothetical protein